MPNSGEPKASRSLKPLANFEKEKENNYLMTIFISSSSNKIDDAMEPNLFVIHSIGWNTLVGNPLGRLGSPAPGFGHSLYSVHRQLLGSHQNIDKFIRHRFPIKSISTLKVKIT